MLRLIFGIAAIMAKNEALSRNRKEIWQIETRKNAVPSDKEII